MVFQQVTSTGGIRAPVPCALTCVQPAICCSSGENHVEQRKIALIDVYVCLYVFTHVYICLYMFTCDNMYVYIWKIVITP